jgi:molecular chaperone GrpE
MTEQEWDEIREESMKETNGTDEKEALMQALAEEREKSAGYLSSWQRAQADFINYKRRVEQERQDFSRSANANLILSILPVIDDLDRALGNVPEELAGASWVDGIQLIAQKMKSILEAQGMEKIEAVGEMFDPNLHEALRQDRGQEGIILAEIETGYRLNERVLRPSRVVVGNGEGETE